MLEPTPSQILSGHTPHPLAVEYAPILHFDRHEPFLPLAVGYSILRESGTSPSFPRYLALTDDGYSAETILEYAVWWDWDIEHLYELEHLWVWLDGNGEIVHQEGSWHGLYHALTGAARTGNHIHVLSEPGKHAFAPDPTWYTPRLDDTRRACEKPGRNGLLIPQLFEGIIQGKTPQLDATIQNYLHTHAFTPTFDFQQAFPIYADLLVDWQALSIWIPQRVAWWVEKFSAEG